MPTGKTQHLLAVSTGIFYDIGVYRDIGYAQEGYSYLPAPGLGHFILGDEAHLHQNLFHGPLALLGYAAALVQAALADLAGFEQNLHYAIFGLLGYGHLSTSSAIVTIDACKQAGQRKDG
ncbi:MAG: hypothetical protein ACOX1G_08165 [bacterium]|jgi:hypothetical protein